MRINTLSTAFTTDKVDESRDFYVEHFNATVLFDCGWYVSLCFGSKALTLQFMSPQRPEHRLGSGEGLMYNFAVDDVDAEHNRLVGAGLEVLVPLEEHPWGDKGFAVKDPNGIALYIYSLREPDDNFRQFYKREAEAE